MSRCTILIGGDVCPINRNLPAFRQGVAAPIFNDLLPEFAAADFSVVNLECPLIDAPTPIAKAGATLGVDPRCLEAIKNAGIGAVNLANNHIMDHGPQGLRRTIRACREAGVDFFGAGENLAEAGQPLIKDFAGPRVAFLGMAEHEFSIAGRASPGANPLDVIYFRRFVRERQKDYDHLIALLHAGKEHYPYPSPTLQKTCRFLGEEGASAVICQHSHCPGSFESYRGAALVYGQGNLLFDSFDFTATWEEFPNGFLVKLTLERNLPGAALEIVPHTQPAQSSGVRRMDPTEEAGLRSKLDERNRALADEAEIERLWSQLCEGLRDPYMSILRGHGRWLTGLNRRLAFVWRLYSRRAVGNLLGIVRCEIHHEVLTTVLCALDDRVNRRGRT